MKHYPALGLEWPHEPAEAALDEVLALIDDYGPTAVEPLARGIRVFFQSEADRNRASEALTARRPAVARTSSLIPDEDWAARSQASLTAVRVGRLIIAPPWAADASLPDAAVTGALADASVVDAMADDPMNRGPIRVVIQPSMGFGTGHHASTRLCLALLQRHMVVGVEVLDVGTGSGVLAIASACLGAARALGIDTDADALDNARDNIALNRITAVDLEIGDIMATPGTLRRRFDVTLANLTGTLLGRAAQALVDTLKPGGVVIASGFQHDERVAVSAALARAGGRLVDEREEQGWIGAAYRTARWETAERSPKLEARSSKTEARRQS